MNFIKKYKNLALAIILFGSLSISFSVQAQIKETYVHSGAHVHQYDKAKTSIWGSTTHKGSWGSEENGEVLFLGETWTNDTMATMPGSGTFHFAQPRPFPYTNNDTQYLNGGYNWGSGVGSSFPDFVLENTNNLILAKDCKVRDTFTFVDGHVILDHYNFTVGDDDPGEILGYDETRFFVTNGPSDNNEGFLERKNILSVDGEEAFPVGSAVGDYTPGQIKNDGAGDDYSMRVFENTYLDGYTGNTFNERTVAKTWDVEERQVGGSNVTLELQHNQESSVAGPASEGVKFLMDIDKHYISHWVGTTPNGPAQGNGVDITSGYKWDALSMSKRYAGEAGNGYITTGTAIADALVSKRENLTSFSPYTKTIYPGNTINPVVDFAVAMVDGSVTSNVKRNDQDLEGDSIEVTRIGGVLIGASAYTLATPSGSITIDRQGNYSYIPSSSFIGRDSVQYSLCDNGEPSVCEDEWLYFEVVPVTDHSDINSNSTVANPDEGISYGDTVFFALMANDADPEQDEQIFKGVVNPNTGVLQSTGTISTIPGKDMEGNSIADVGDLVIGLSGKIVFVPSAGFTGTVDELRYTICDTVSAPNKACQTASITVKVNPDNPTTDEVPTAGDDFFVTDKNRTSTGNWLENDTDPNARYGNDRIRVNGGLDNINPDVPTGIGTVIETLTTDEGGTLQMKDDGLFIYIPPADFMGMDQVGYQICDTADVVQCDSATIYILVTPVNTDYGDLSLATIKGARFTDRNNDGLPDGENSVWLGSGITDEVIANTNLLATADVDDQLVCPAALDSNTTNVYKVPVSCVKPGISAYASLAIDWNADGVFDTTYTTSLETTSGADTAIFSLVVTPTGFNGGQVNYRVAVSNDTNDLAREAMNNGEVEDYQIYTEKPLPVDLIHFTARALDQNTAQLDWITASEINNSHFEVERSIDGVVFSKIGNVDGHGNSNSIHKYTYIDTEVPTGTTLAYYRLKQVDFDGQFEYTQKRAVDFGDIDWVSTVQVYPNPMRNTLYIALDERTKVESVVRISDMNGKQLEQMHLQPRSQPYKLDFSGLRKGVYFVSIAAGDQAKHIKVFKN